MTAARRSCNVAVWRQWGQLETGVTDSSVFRFRAFLSYSHRDRAWGEWLHKALENYRIPKDLVGQTRAGSSIPKSLRPVFRDREDFAAGPSLNDKTNVALEASQFLIVLCSPNAAKSTYVSEEVRRFKALGSGRVLALIVDGEPNEGSDNDCFPPALRFKIGADGALTTEHEEPIAADARPQGDGKNLALLKIIAGLLGLELDDLRRRDAAAQLRRRRMWMGITAGFALLALLASASTVFAYQKLIESEDRLDRAVEIAYGFVSEAVSLSNKFGAPAELLQGLLRRTEQALDRLIKDGADTPKLHHRKAQMLLNFALSYQTLGQTGPARERAQEANGLLRILTSRQPDDLSWQRDLTVSYGVIGDLLQLQGNSAAALENYRTALAIAQRLVAADAQNAIWYRDLSTLTVKIADLLIPLGDIEGALANYLADLSANTRWAQAHPEDLAWQYDLALDHGRIGAVLYGQGKIDQAIMHYREGLAIAERLVEADPDRADWQQNLSVLHVNFGDARWAQGSLEDALASYQAALPIRERMAAGDRRNAGAQRELSVIQERIAEAQAALGNPAAALVQMRAALAIRQRLAGLDPDNTQWQSDLAKSHSLLGDILKSQGDLDQAAIEYGRNRDILQRLVAKDPANREWQRDLSRSHLKVADVAAARQHWPEALAGYQAGAALAEALAEGQPDNAEWQHDLATALGRVGQAFAAQSEFGKSLDSYRKALAILDRLSRDPANNAARRDALVTHNKIGDIFLLQKDVQQAIASYQTAFEIAERLATGNPQDPQGQRDLALGHLKLASAHWLNGDTAQAALLLRQGRAIVAALLAKTPTAAQLKADLAKFDELIAIVERPVGAADKP